MSDAPQATEQAEIVEQNNLKTYHPFGKQSAQSRKLTKHSMDTYLWSETDGIYYDYNTKTQSPHKFPSVTTLWPLWSQAASPAQARRLVANLSLFEQDGGLAATNPAKASRKQWDYPCGWAPHQILAWRGLAQYGFAQHSARLATKWLNMVTSVYKSTGKLLEKYNVCDIPNAHLVSAEYGNQGNENEGFGWTNSSVLIAADFSET